MPGEKTVKDLMIPLDDYPHIPYWFTLRQTIAIVREAAIKLERQVEPWAVLLFDEKHRLMGIVNLRDIIKGLEPRILAETMPSQGETDLPVRLKDFFTPNLAETAQRPASEVMRPPKVTVHADDPIAKALFFMITENMNQVPVVQDNKPVGMIRLKDLFKEISDIVLAQSEPDA